MVGMSISSDRYWPQQLHWGRGVPTPHGHSHSLQLQSHQPSPAARGAFGAGAGAAETVAGTVAAGAGGRAGTGVQVAGSAHSAMQGGSQCQVLPPTPGHPGLGQGLGVGPGQGRGLVACPAVSGHGAAHAAHARHQPTAQRLVFVKKKAGALSYAGVFLLKLLFVVEQNVLDV